MESLLANHGWFDFAQPFEHTVHLTRGACLWMLLTRRGACDTYVKFSDRISLAVEAVRSESASRCYPMLAPQFVGYDRTHDGVEVIVCRAVDYRGLTSRDLMGVAARPVLQQGLRAYFRASRQARMAPGALSVGTAVLVAEMRAYFSKHPLQDAVRAWLDGEIGAQLGALPEVPQHGDLVLNNIGVGRGGALVIFDWEDFGATNVPGLDLFTLAMSLCGSDLQALRADPQVDALLVALCGEAGLDVALFRRLVPAYALVFRYLKRNYGPEVRERMDRVLAAAAAADGMAVP